ncbi:hypothetical protein Scep_029759 [Stephania cephalantha]|uniref:Uncharacterized protein n=1 Tax=Stephania cephalantha TaxID=152367 RepID=A0AAP0E638_9MAGN
METRGHGTCYLCEKRFISDIGFKNTDKVLSSFYVGTWFRRSQRLKSVGGGFLGHDLYEIHRRRCKKFSGQKVRKRVIFSWNIFNIKIKNT